ncbi:DUF6745 domain-containing protein [Nonomuraea gerenzanensis]|uniref:DUF6745 domain-containing protein n=1 Tax=Nonomuraea gerenzanensis TaxID=93944 RepID=A0A1M4E1M2_9ACTN|nr:hypothetical protein [Nonomuraea gerenzanensis]UBU15000.1 hypothetical protein LCN96_08250 [Nonomuraea gerenzanensis]SBO92740.1 FIG01124133: hypothetical protein [Nonomuraea gerenzanensis]
MTTLTWERVAVATGPGEGAEEAVRQAYREAGLAEPERVLVLPSPLAGAVAAAWLTGDEQVRASLEQAIVKQNGTAVPAHGGGDPGRSVREAVRTGPWERARAAAYAELGPGGWAERWAETGGRLWPQVERLVGDLRRAIADWGAGRAVGSGRDSAVAAGRGRITDLGADQDGERLRRVTLDAVLGQHDAPWLSAFDDADGLGGLMRVAERAGWWWPYERLAIVTERPVELHLDDLGRPHRADGPAVSYADGFALHAWHGMPVPPGFGATMTGLTPERIRAEPNAELRRAMLEHFGIERYLAESGAEPVQSDETGVLWRIELPDDEALVMVEVVNSTPEPDGTSRTYFLRVPPWVRRAREGVAWTFGLAEADYRPERET